MLTDQARTGRGRSESGQTLVEYALIIAVVSLGAVAALTFLRDEITSVFSDSGSALSEAGAAGGSTPPPPPAAPGSPTITSGPAEGSVVAATNASFGFTGDGTQTSFECRFDAAAVFTTCTSPQAYAGLAVGTHTFRVQASNAGGTSAPAVRSWTVGTAPSGVNVAIQCAPGAGTCNAGDTATANLTGQQGVPAATVTYLWERNTALGAICSTGAGWSSLGTTASIVLPPLSILWDPVRVTVTWTHPLGNATDQACVLFYP
jgi:Flp pilus assembly pilin Flp